MRPAAEHSPLYIVHGMVEGKGYVVSVTGMKMTNRGDQHRCSSGRGWSSLHWAQANIEQAAFLA